MTTLADYLRDHKLTPTEFGRTIGVSSEAVRRYRDGTRIPERETMALIVEATKSAVTPNDFYGVSGPMPGEQSGQPIDGEASTHASPADAS